MNNEDWEKSRGVRCPECGMEVLWIDPRTGVCMSCLYKKETAWAKKKEKQSIVREFRRIVSGKSKRRLVRIPGTRSYEIVD